MRRWAIKIASGLSLILALAVAWLWWESSVVIRDVGYSWVDAPGGRISHVMVSSIQGKLIISHVVVSFPGPLTHSVYEGPRFETATGHQQMWSFGWASWMQMAMHGSQVCGFGGTWASGIPYSGYVEDVQHLQLPDWFVIAVALLPSVLCGLLIIRDRKRRASQGFCPNCRYDLRAHKPGDRCPECGAPIAKRVLES